MILAAEWGVGQVLWSVFWFFLFFLWIWLVITIFADIIRSDDLSGWAKALWSLAIIFLPYLGIFIYVIVRGGSMTDRSVAAAQEHEEATRAYIQSVSGGGGGAADELAKLADLHSAGTIDDAEYAAAKAKVLGG